jgi:hypothetical protein
VYQKLGPELGRDFFLPTPDLNQLKFKKNKLPSTTLVKVSYL